MKRPAYPTYLVATLAATLLATSLSACQPADERTTTTPSAPEQPLDAKKDSLGDPASQPEVTTDDTLSLPESPQSPATSDNISTADLNEIQTNYDKAISKMNDEMQLMLSMNNIDVAFARGMLGHHRGAMDLTKLATRYGGDAELQQLSEQITITEQAEIDALKKWLASHPDTRDIDPLTEQTRPAYQYAIDAMVQKMREARNSNEADVVFAKVMLAHHRGAEAIAKIQLNYGKDEEMRALAAQIIEEQLPEMARLDAWLRARGIVMSPRLVEEKIVGTDIDSSASEADVKTDADSAATPKETKSAKTAQGSTTDSAAN